MSLKSLLFHFEGRLSRGQYGKILLLIFIPLLVFMVFMAALDGLSPAPGDTVVQTIALVVLLIEVVWALLSIWILFAAMTKRLHDFNKREWALLLVFVPFIGSVLPFALLFFPGDASDNRFGPPPTDIL